MEAGEAIGAASLMDRTQVVSPLVGLPVAGSQFFEAVDFFGDRDLTGGGWDEYYEESQKGYDYANLGDQPVEPNKTNVPAPISLVPTSSINPERPRTVAAGYDRVREVLTVVFRDGTFYNYYEVSQQEWAAFKARKSKGRFILNYLDDKPRGVAAMSQVPYYAREALYRIARTGQWANDAQREGQTDRST